jgi:methyl-accepting chemotaxis protein
MNPSNWRIGTRLGLSFAAMLLLVALTVAIGIQQLRNLSALGAQRDALGDRYADIERWHGAVTLNLTRALAIGRSGYHPLTVQSLEPQMKPTSEAITALQKALDKTIQDGEDRKLFDAIGARRERYVASRALAVAAFKEGRMDDGLRIANGAMTTDADAYLAALTALKELAGREQDTVMAAANEQSQRAQTALLALGAVALALGSALAWAVSRSVTLPMAGAIAAAQRIAAKNLTTGVAGTGRQDEVGVLLRASRDMQESLTGMVREIRAGTVNLAGASAEIAAASSDLSTRTEQAASSLQNTASTMEQITATVKLTADSARNANDLAASASEVAQRGGTVVAQVVSTMDEIHSSSQRIADIIGTIDGIAFQTNILALNAAVEAARAGEQGRGFAVVAGEVRNLAQRSADAAREIKVLIGTSVEKVGSGARLVADAGGTMQDIVASVQRVSHIIGELLHAATEQNLGIGQINDALAHLDQMTQQNSALVEETAASAESLKDQAGKLSSLVATFRTPEAEGLAQEPALA